MPDNKKKVGLMTLSNVVNFGSALQTHATIKTVEKLGYDCVLIDYRYPTNWHTNNATGNENTGNNVIIRLIKLILRKIYLFKIARMIKQMLNRKQKHYSNIFYDFVKKTPVTSVLYDRKSILKNPPVFDIYMTGSDQTWNPRYLHTDYSFLLNFAPENAPRIAYSASFGAKKMLPAYREDYIKYLQKYDRISVREQSGVPLVKELTGKDAQHLFDPTLMLNKTEWKKAVSGHRLNLPEKFIFCYILTYVFNPYPQLNDLINHLSKISGLPVVILGGGINTEGITAQILTNEIGPEGFLECYERASFVITTSFHGTAFSVNFEKDFYAVLNPNSSADDRVISFLQATDMENRGLLLPQTDIASITLEDMKTDHTASIPRVREMRQKTFEFLTEALDFASKKCGEYHND